VTKAAYAMLVLMLAATTSRQAQTKINAASAFSMPILTKKSAGMLRKSSLQLRKSYKI
jgi:hypothetical protein